jgi:methyl-accepting chemotaxis protein
MQLLSNLRVSTRLWMLVGVMSALLLGLGAVGLYGIGKSNDALKTVYEDRTIPASQLAALGYLTQRNRVLVMDMLLVNTAANTEKRYGELQVNTQTMGTIWDAYMATYLTLEEKALAADYAEHREAYLRQGLLPAAEAMKAGRAEEARELYNTKISPSAPKVHAAEEKLMDLQLDVARQQYEGAVARYAQLRVASTAAIVAGLLFAGLFGAVLVGGLGRQLGAEPGEAAAVARQVAAGDLSVRIDLKVGDNSSLMAQLQEMQQSLARVVTGVRANAESVATASAQIAQGNQDLSQRTEQQASALQQTAATMEELGTTVNQNADNAQQADRLAQAASDVALKGGEVVAQVVETMKDISESSRRIGDIIGTIDSIAFQTNILALNAAVEAARAGEQGRGFAVVASEVRTLAQRAAEAAKEIKSLIGASMEQVQQGTTLVDEAGQTMNEVVASIRRVTDIVAEISSASIEQSSGVNQVGEAVGQMDQATQQNAALVEESAAAAESLKSQAASLVRAVSVFSLANREQG